ncbi:17888_t:CDS:2 [Gigaspora margarita]|uniref:17888_t:CDS:1 n=1 Tax=Gigaspora margarita TaxID=4874 RepID=A0ABN7V1I7_GIGMA|nr:17888_t:CDS:2 [Gigaspora margarita]
MSAKTSKVTETSKTGKTSRTSKTPKTSQVSQVSQVKTMKEQAMELYMEPIIQEEESKYFEEYESKIHYGESPDSSDYRREFGFCRVECLQIQK